MESIPALLLLHIALAPVAVALQDEEVPIVDEFEQAFRDEELEAAASDLVVEYAAPLDAWSRPDDRPPVAAWWTETIPEGSWRFGYRYENLSYDGLGDGRSDFSSKKLEKRGFDEIPEELAVRTHTLEVTYGAREFTSVYATLPFHVKELEGDATAGDLDQENSGLGDLILGFTHHCCSDEDGGRMMWHLGLGIPTGSVDEKGDAPGGGSERLSYPMQLGTGTFTVHPGVYWIENEDTWTWGVGARWRVHLSKNDEGYAPGDTATFQAWGSREVAEDLIGTLRLQSSFMGDYHGEDDELDKNVNPLNDEHRQGGLRTDVFAGLGWELGGEEHASRLDLEVGVPVDEWLDGPQMSNEWTVGFGWRYSF